MDGRQNDPRDLSAIVASHRDVSAFAHVWHIGSKLCRHRFRVSSCFLIVRERVVKEMSDRFLAVEVESVMGHADVLRGTLTTKQMPPATGVYAEATWNMPTGFAHRTPYQSRSPNIVPTSPRLDAPICTA